MFNESPGDGQTRLVARLKAGEDAAFEQLVREQGGRMLSVARRLLGTEQDAQDAMQDAFISAFRAVGDFRDGSSLATWLHRIVINSALQNP